MTTPITLLFFTWSQSAADGCSQYPNLRRVAEVCCTSFRQNAHPRRPCLRKTSGALIAFVNLGEINGHLLEFEHSLDVAAPHSEPLANSMTVFMVRGFFMRLQFLYAQFPSIKVSRNLQFEPFCEAVEWLQWCQLKVLAATADGASVNHKLFKLHRDGKLGDPQGSEPIRPRSLEELLPFWPSPSHQNSYKLLGIYSEEHVGKIGISQWSTLFYVYSVSLFLL